MNRKIKSPNALDPKLRDQVQRDPMQIAKDISELTNELLHIYKTESLYQYPIDLLHYSHFYEIYSKILFDISLDPIKSIKIQQHFLNECHALYFSTLNSFFSDKAKDSDHIKEPKDDRRFIDPMWQTDPFFKTLKKSYYLLTKYSLRWLQSLSTLDRKTRQQLHFYIKNFLDFMSPSNFILTNPEVLRTTFQKNGENFLAGLKNLLQDLVVNKGRFNISKTDLKFFKVGKNLAMTKGKIIFQNDLMQLIQYLPTTSEVYQTPILFIPPWINKYYVLDLSPENSLVRWLISQGFSVFMISWVNPDSRFANKEFADYMLEGPIQALNTICETTKADSVHMVGYCIGGTLLACTLAYMAKMRDSRAKSATYFMSLIDFTNPGELGVFIDKTQLDMLDKIMQEKGYLDGRLLDMTFNLLRPNDLIWPYFINNYLLGKPPRPFDLLYWNADSSNLAYTMYSFYLRHMYLKNELRKPNKIKLKGVPIDLNEIKVKSFCLASETDHITLWKSAYASAKLLNTSIRFVLTESGHVRGVVNPPPDSKYNFFTNEKLGHDKKLPQRAKDWLSQAKKHKGSWWPYWAEWLKEFDTLEGLETITVSKESRDPRLNGMPIIENAPGSYVLRRL